MYNDSLLTQLQNIRQLFSEVAPEDSKTLNDYAWTIVKALLQHTEEVDSTTARQFLADSLKLPIERPSKLYSALLSAAVKVSYIHPTFRFAAFLQAWGIENLRPEDHERQQAPVPAASAAGKSFPSLAEKVAKAFAHSLLLHLEDRNLLHIESSPLGGDKRGVFISMLVTRLKEAVGKDGRKYLFVTLTSPDGIEVECLSKQLQPHPLHPLPEGKRHYVNIGQLYDCLLRQKAAPALEASSLSSSLSLSEAFLSQTNPKDIFSEELGYIESIDLQHSHMHIYDGHSRHFVAPIQRFSKEKAGDFVRFIPIIPKDSKFKTAIITSRPLDKSLIVGEAESLSSSLIREIRITSINTEKHFASWELTDSSHPITEQLSPLQLSQGETSPTFTTGYLSLTDDNHIPAIVANSQLSLSSSLTLYAVLYLRRGKDRQKRPHIAKIINA